jgi:hypothetical protein
VVLQIFGSSFGKFFSEGFNIFDLMVVSLSQVCNSGLNNTVVAERKKEITYKKGDVEDIGALNVVAKYISFAVVSVALWIPCSQCFAYASPCTTDRDHSHRGAIVSGQQ